MKKLLFILSLFATAQVSAQEIENENVKAMKEMAARGYFGGFGYKVDDIHTKQVNYALTPKVPVDEVQVRLHTSVNQPLHLIITTTQGKKVAEAIFSRDEYIKEGVVDVSGLKPGKYVYVIQWGGENAHEVPFEKK